MHSKYIEQIMQNGEWEPYRQQDTRLLQLKKQVKDYSGNTTVSGHRHGSFIPLVSVEQPKTPPRASQYSL